MGVRAGAIAAIALVCARRGNSAASGLIMVGGCVRCTTSTCRRAVRL
eukprot:COSAG05_NODE_1206_length_5525_cov_6.815149_8_plen_47_part_00